MTKVPVIVQNKVKVVEQAKPPRARKVVEETVRRNLVPIVVKVKK